MPIYQINTPQETVDVLIEAMSLYLNALYEVPTRSNRINNEIKDAETIIELVQRQNDNGFSFGMPTIVLDGKHYQLLRGVALKYLAAKRSKIALAKRAENVIGSTEAEELQLNKLDEYLHAPDVEVIGTRDPLVKDYLRLLPTEGETADKMNIQVQAGDIYGQLIVAGNNSGDQNQTNYYQIYKSLNKLTEELSRQDINLDAEMQRNAIGDIQTIQSQLTKSSPDKTIIRKALDGLSILADTAQVGQVAVTLTPHVHQLGQFLSQFF